MGRDRKAQRGRTTSRSEEIQSRVLQFLFVTVGCAMLLYYSGSMLQRAVNEGRHGSIVGYGLLFFGLIALIVSLVSSRIHRVAKRPPRRRRRR
jgi:drug/metabolite transporter (DMT)-like permease